MEKDKKAINLLKRYSSWNNPYQKRVLTEEDIKYCIEKGVMYENLIITHEEAINEIKTLANSITMKEAATAFLYSLSSGDNQYRTILSSVVWGRSLEQHTTDSMERITSNYCVCDICNLSLEKDGKHCNTNLNGYSRYRYFSGEQDICEAGYVLLDLREYKKLPKVTYCEEDIKILNRIFGLAQELGPGNKSIALQKLITAEKFFKATKNEINCILGVLAICGVFDTPEKKSVATQFVPNSQRDFVMDSDLFYPLNHWRGKYGINYQAVERIFGNVVGNQLNQEQSITGEVRRNQLEKKKRSKAEQYFTDGKHFVEVANKDRYYYGMNELNSDWDKITKYSVTYNCYKRSELYFEGDVIRKMIYEENRGGEKFFYQEIDMEVLTEERRLVIPKTARGRKQTLTPTLLMTPTYMKGQLMVELPNDSYENSVWSYNSANDQYLPLPPGKILNNEDFQEYTKKYIENLPQDYKEVIENFRNKKRVTVKFHSGAVFRMQLTPKKYTYGLILGKVREILKWQEMPENHPLHRCMTQPILFRQYDIITEKGNMTIEELENVLLHPLDVAQDNDILWETYPIIGYKKLKETDIDLGFSLYKNKVVMGFGIYDYEEDLFPDLEKIADYGMVRLAIHGQETISDYDMRKMKLREEVEKRLGLDHENATDEFAKRYGGITRKEFIELLQEREKKVK